MKALKAIFLISLFLPASLLSQSDDAKSIQIGDSYEGGKVFFIDHTGEHGRIAAPYDQTSKKVKWGHNGITNALSASDGQVNSSKVLDFHNTRYEYPVFCAARYCDTLSLNGYTDWYLPAIDELRILFEQRRIVGNFMVGDYCSSTEYGKKDAYFIHFKPHKRPEFYYNKKDEIYFVRCIRRF